MTTTKRRVLGISVAVVAILGISTRIWGQTDGSSQWPLLVFGVGCFVVLLVAVAFVAFVDRRPVQHVGRDAVRGTARDVRGLPGRLRTWWREALAPHRRRP